ncbi:MAG: NAD(P)-dependent oxidoreductase [Chloroflexi bacterium]|nr:NAD(P)-dependent oxidoreductase [Chloroflexota bacterium]MCL5274909.1 NAD(P)-dependent oxidoreductase [Chloroflexota bacterium]
MQQIAVLGLGIMGGGIARNLLRDGYPVTVYNRTKAKAQPLLDAGASWSDSPRAAAAGADIVISVVGDDAASRAMWLGGAGALAAMRPGAVALECTTLSVGWVRELAEHARAAGARFVDAPMAGSKNAAAAGQLSLYVGATPELFDELRPMLASFATTIVHFGPTGSGAMYKLINNMIVAANVTALAEGIAMAEKAGLDMGTFLQTITTGAVGSPIVKMKSPQIIARNHTDTHFALRWMHKDLTYALRAADELGVALPDAALAHELLRMAMQRGWSDQDFAVVAELVRG